MHLGCTTTHMPQPISSSATANPSLVPLCCLWGTGPHIIQRSKAIDLSYSVFACCCALIWLYSDKHNPRREGCMMHGNQRHTCPQRCELLGVGQTRIGSVVSCCIAQTHIIGHCSSHYYTTPVRNPFNLLENVAEDSCVDLASHMFDKADALLL